MSHQIIRKINDTGRTWKLTNMTYQGQPIILSGATVILKKRSIRDGTVTTGSCTITDVSGSVEYQPTAADVGTEGKYQLEFYVRYGDDTYETIPTDGQYILFVNPRVDDM